MKIGLQGFGPFTLRALGLGAAALILLAAARAGRKSFRLEARQTPTLILAGLLNIAGFNLLTAFAQLQMPTARAAILAFTMPLWAALFAWLVLGERPGGRGSIGLLLGASGLLLLLIPLLMASGGIPPGVPFILGAAVSWAAGTVLIKHRPIEGEPLVVTGLQLAVGAVVAIAGALAFESLPEQPGAAPLVALGYHLLLGLALPYFLWFGLVARLPAGVAALTTLLIPIVGVSSSMVLLGDRLGPFDTLGFALILAAVLLVLRR